MLVATQSVRATIFRILYAAGMMAALLAGLCASRAASAEKDRPAGNPKQAKKKQPENTSENDGYASDIKANEVWISNGRAPFHSLDEPGFVSASSATLLRDDDQVFGLTVNGESRAYSKDALTWHHIVNDTIGKPEAGGKRPVAITYCSACNHAAAFDASFKGKRLLFDLHGYYKPSFTMTDRATQTIWWQIGGRAIKGAWRNRRLTVIPMQEMSWGQWKRLHPDSQVMNVHKTPMVKPNQETGLLASLTSDRSLLVFLLFGCMLILYGLLTQRSKPSPL